MQNDLTQYILANFHRALGKNHIQPYYQPVIRTISRQLCSFEALARWVDPVHGVIRPDQFIPVLEERRLIHLLDSSIIRQVCAHMRKRMDAGETPIPVSVNLSRLDFLLCDIFKVVDDIVTRYQIPHDFLYIEITESVIAENEGLMGEIVDKFRSAGYQVWMDDFGSGYSSLNVLKDYTFDEIKLDMQFLRSFNQRSQRIMNAMIHMAKEIGIHTLAEGVETQEQASYLRNVGCEKLQGYFYGKPLPFDEAIQHMAEMGIPIEQPQDRKYYDDIGRIDLLSAVPFMTQAQKDALKTARQLNSIPLAIFEIHPADFSVLFYNTAFEETAAGSGLTTALFTQEHLRVCMPLSMLSERFSSLMDASRESGEGRMNFISHDDYYEVQTKCIARTRDAYSVLVRLSNLSKASKQEHTGLLDESLRQLFTLFERITLVDLRSDTVVPLYVTTQENLVSSRTGIRQMVQEYADLWIFPDDREEYLRLMDISTLDERLRESGQTHVSKYLRTNVRHGQYAWKKYNVLRLHSDTFAVLIRNVHEDLLAFEAGNRLNAPLFGNDNTFSAELLWHTLIQSDIIRLFWKDADRRFLGASRGFLNYYGFSSADDILGKNDEQLGWHIHPDGYMNDELRVIHEGIATHNIPGHCIRDGQNREIVASKTPLYDYNGAVKGLLGCFIDRDLLNQNDERGKERDLRDMLTGLLNTRGIYEEALNFQDEYNLRNSDFIRIHVAIDDFSSLNRVYGFDFGDKAIHALGTALKHTFGTSAAVGRYTGHQFVLLRQIEKEADIAPLVERVREVGASIRQIEGVALTFYLSVGYALYSECKDLEEQTHKAEVRLLVDHDEHASTENRLSRASEIFHLYDDLPISYSVYKVLTDAQNRVYDAVLFYVNRVFENNSGMTASELLGRRTSELFPALQPEWYDRAGRAAVGGETVVEKYHYPPTGRDYYMTVSPIIRTGYCCFTYQDMDVLNGEPQ